MRFSALPQSVVMKSTDDALPGGLSNPAIRNYILERLGELGREMAFRVYVQVLNGEVVLRGAVNSPYDRLTLLHVVGQAPGVREVHDALELPPLAGRPGFNPAEQFRPNAVVIARASLALLLIVATLAWWLAPLTRVSRLAPARDPPCKLTERNPLTATTQTVIVL
jgi:hypothetical protein